MQFPCPDCGAPCDADARTCPACLAGLTVLCFCGATLPHSGSHCEACGTELREPAPRPRPRRRRRVLGVLVAMAIVAAVVGLVIAKRRDRWQPRPIDRARMLRLQEDYSGAALLYGQVLAAAPHHTTANLELASCLRQLGRPASEYVTYMIAAAEGRPDDAVLQSEVARELTLLGRVEEALRHATAAVDAGATTPQVHQLRAWLELTCGDPDPARALEAAERARAAGASSATLDLVEAECRLLLRRDLLTGGRSVELSRAVTAVQRALETLPAEGPPDLSVILLRARNSLLLRHFAAAEAEADRVLRAEDGPPAGSPTRGVLLTIRGIARLERGKATGARADFETALGPPSGRQAARHLGRMLSLADSVARATPLLAELALAEETADAGLALVVALRATGRSDLALPRARALAERAPDDRDYALLLAGLLAAEEQSDAALALYERLEADTPDALEPRLGALALRLARASERDEDVPALLEQAERLRADFPEEAGVLAVALDALLLAGRAPQACSLGRDAVRAHPYDPAVRALLAAALERVPDTAYLLEAAMVWRQARTMTPRELDLHVREATAWMRAGRASAAGLVCAEGLVLDPEHVPLLRLQATAEEHLGHWTEAALVLRRLLRADPDDDTALRLVDALHRSGAVGEADDVARNYRSRGDAEEFRTTLAVLRALHVDGLDAAVATARGSGSAGLQLDLLLVADDIAGALEVAERGLAGDDGPTALEGAIVLLLADRRHPPALASLVSSAAANLPADGAGRERLQLLADGAGRALAGDLGPVERRLTERILADPGDLTARFVLGVGRCETAGAAAGLPLLREVVASGRGYPIQRRQLLSRLDEAMREELDAVRRLALLRERAAIAPRDAPAIERLVVAETQLGNVADALALVGSLLGRTDVTPEQDHRLRLARAQLLCAVGDWKTAREEILRLEPAAQSRLAARSVLAHAALGEGRLDEAHAALAELLEREETRSLAAVAFVWLHVRRGDPAGAEAFWRAWQADRPLDALVCVRVADVLEGAGAAERARSVLATGSDREPSNRAVRGALQRMAADHLPASESAALARNLATACESKEPFTAAMIRAAAAIRLGGDAERGAALAAQVASDPRATPFQAASARVLGAEALLQLGRFDDALRTAEAEHAHWRGGEPSTSEQRAVAARVHFVMGVAHMRGERLDEAAMAFERSLAHDPRDLAALNNFVWCSARGPSPSAATLRGGRRLTTRAPQRPEFWDTHAVAAAALGEPDEASDCWRRAQQLLRAGGADATDALYRRIMGRLVDHLRRNGQTGAADELARELDTRD